MIQLFHPKYETEEILSELRPVFNSGWTGTGPQCAEFEKRFSEYIQDDKAMHSVFLNSATAALQISLRLTGLSGTKAKVATTPITFVSTNAVILYEELEPVFCDIDWTGSLDCASVITAIEDGAKAVIWVHYGGSVSNDFYTLMNWLEKKGRKDVTVIEDCAHAMGASYRDGNRVGSRPDTLSCFSFHSVKNLPTFDGGALSVRSQEEMERARRLSWLGIDKNTYQRTNTGNEVYKWLYDVPELGWKFNGNDVAATIALVQLRYLDRDNAFRRQIYDWYLRDLALLDHSGGSSHHLASIGFDTEEERNQAMGALKAHGIAPGVHYRPNFDFPVFESFYQRGQCPVAERFAKTTLSLPNHLRLTRNDVDYISGVIDAC